MGCGTGQATVGLADHFESVIGVDMSQTQLDQATQHSKITYQQGTVETYLTILPSQSVQCMTSAQAVHWMDIPSFYKQVHRLLEPGGVLALWTYGMPHFPNHPKLDKQFYHIYDGVLEDYWDSRRKLVENMYRDIPLIDETYPGDFEGGERIQGMQDLDIRKDISLEQLKGYMRSWSGYAKYCKENEVEQGSDRDPVETLLTKELMDGDATTLCIWPVAMLVSVKKDGATEKS
jgi:ubiquinone/menaquinone biosynthesis C-methylase UbiE